MRSAARTWHPFARSNGRAIRSVTSELIKRKWRNLDFDGNSICIRYFQPAGKVGEGQSDREILPGVFCIANKSRRRRRRAVAVLNFLFLHLALLLVTSVTFAIFRYNIFAAIWKEKKHITMHFAMHLNPRRVVSRFGTLMIIVHLGSRCYLFRRVFLIAIYSTRYVWKL